MAADPREDAQDRTAAAAERNRELGAIRAIDDPAKFAKAVRIVRLALQRKRLSLADLGFESDATAEVPS